MENDLIQIIAEEEDISKKQVKTTVEMLDDGNTIPFIARYRKENTGGLDEEQLRTIEERIEYLRNLNKRKNEVINSIKEQDKLTEELQKKIEKAQILQEVEDLYRPYKKKRKTRASKAKAKGLEPLAEKMWKQDIKTGNLKQIGEKYIDPDKELKSLDDIFQGAQDIIAEWISDNAKIRKNIRKVTFSQADIKSKVKNKDKDQENKYKMYYQYKESVNKIPPHRILALNRGEEENILQIKIKISQEKIFSIIKEKIIKGNSIFREKILEAIKDAYKRLIAPSIEREVRNELTEKAETHAIEVFGKNLRSLLLQSPLKDNVVMGIDPGFRTGSKVVVVDKRGNLQATETIYPHPPQNKKQEAQDKVLNLIDKYKIDAVAIGNGTASRETELFVAEIINKKNDIKYTIINEAGASVYSASKIARKEFPDLDVSMRGAVSIARRVQDPLAELVKIDPAHMGVGLYQHDIDEKKLSTSLKEVVESVVNYVGVDLNTASFSLLKYVAGINSSVAENIVKYRKENSGFEKRKELKNVYGLGPKTFKQAAGFLRISTPVDPLARTPIHPESYPETETLIKKLGYQLKDILNKNELQKVREDLKGIEIEKLASEIGLGIPTLKDIIKALKKPGRDPREELSQPIFRNDVLKIEDLTEGMVLKGTVRNVVDFGAFVDIGIKQDGLVHISELSHDYVDNPLEIVKVGETVTVKILNIDKSRQRVSLSMKL